MALSPSHKTTLRLFVLAQLVSLPDRWQGLPMAKPAHCVAQRQEVGMKNAKRCLGFAQESCRAVGSLRRLAIIGSLLLVMSPAFSSTPAYASCSGKAIRSGDNIASIINNAAGGTSFCIAPGTYKPSATIKLKDNDHLFGTGTSRDGVLITTGKLQIIINATSAHGVVLKNLSISGAVNACPGKDCGATGDGVHGGTNLKATNVHVYANGRTGFSSAIGLTISGSRLDHNGAVHGAMDGVSSGVKSSAPLTVINSTVDHNYGNGVWCDMQCGAFTVKGSQVTYNVSTGIHDEISQGPAVIANNVVKYNNTAKEAGHGGIGIIDSKNVSVYGNKLGGNKGTGISAREDARAGCGPPSNLCGYQLYNVSIHDNYLNGDALYGCGTSGVKCYNNTLK
ncbi:MAG: hypothetical protein QOH48_124 [Actinomycetota bacterium]|jgi:hypothetical protein|nr:hypothetical protein [Actinomycetota bacterium]